MSAASKPCIIGLWQPVGSLQGKLPSNHHLYSTHDRGWVLGVFVRLFVSMIGWLVLQLYLLRECLTCFCVVIIFYDAFYPFFGFLRRIFYSHPYISISFNIGFVFECIAKCHRNSCSPSSSLKDSFFQ